MEKKLCASSLLLISNCCNSLRQYHCTPVSDCIASCNCKKYHRFTIVCTHGTETEVCGVTFQNRSHSWAYERWRRHMQRDHGICPQSKTVDLDRKQTMENIERLSNENNLSKEEYVYQLIRKFFN